MQTLCDCCAKCASGAPSPEVSGYLGSAKRRATVSGFGAPREVIGPAVFAKYFGVRFSPDGKRKASKDAFAKSAGYCRENGTEGHPFKMALALDEPLEKATKLMKAVSLMRRMSESRERTGHFLS